MRDPLKEHKLKRGKLEIRAKAPLKTREDLAVWYTPGVGQVASFLARHPEAARDYTMKGNAVLVASDGSAVLGLGNIGPYGALPVMEGKAMIFKEFAGIDAYPLVLSTQNAEEVVRIIAEISPAFGGINLEDIAAPRCFEIEEKLKARLDIPVFHDDQHGTAIVVLAGLTNALKVAKKKLSTARIVILGAGAAGNAITRLLVEAGAKDVLVLDSRGLISCARQDLDKYKKELALITNKECLEGGLDKAIEGADVFVGVARGNILSEPQVAKMADKAIVFALSNPTPEIMPDAAKRAGAFIIATGRSDYPNQINNSLVFPGIFRGALDRRVRQITTAMKLAAAKKLAALVKEPSAEKIIPGPFEKGIVAAIASVVK